MVASQKFNTNSDRTKWWNKDGKLLILCELYEHRPPSSRLTAALDANAPYIRQKLDARRGIPFSSTIHFASVGSLAPGE
ncbi:Uncharacterized protein HZ326_25899 [Fusarium oxysporum f. sp. albedinis]|nr:Uncharacterized protein HZ326_25899 [Fusarium oxysporum f. sp. albedinis]